MKDPDELEPLFTCLFCGSKSATVLCSECQMEVPAGEYEEQMQEHIDHLCTLSCG